MENKKIIYVDVESMDFWWGFYGLTDNPTREDIVLYTKDGEDYTPFADTCICTKGFFENRDLSEDFYTDEIRDFITSDSIHYYYYYDNPDNKDFYEVPYEAERNEKNIKPSHIEIWYPNYDIDIKAIKDSIAAFCEKFLSVVVEDVKFVKIMSYEAANKEFMKSTNSDSFAL